MTINKSDDLGSKCDLVTNSAQSVLPTGQPLTILGGIVFSGEMTRLGDIRGGKATRI